MAGSTPIYGFPYPQSTDLVADYPTLGQELATDVETVISGLGSGLNIISATSIASGGGSATRTNGQVVFSGVTSISLNGVFSSTYDHYVIKLMATNSTAANFLTRLRTTSDDTAANYSDQLLYGSGSTAAANRASGQTYWRSGYAGTGDSGTVTIDLFGPNLAAATKGNFASCVFIGSTQEASYGSIANSTTTQYTGISIFPGSGTFSGTVRVYGLKNS